MWYQDNKKVRSYPFELTANTKEVIDLGIYKYLTSASLQIKRLAQKDISEHLATKACKFDISLVSSNERNKRVDRRDHAF